MSPIKHLPEGRKECISVALPVDTVALLRTFCANRMTQSKLVHDAVTAYIGGVENAEIQDSEHEGDDRK